MIRPFEVMPAQWWGVVCARRYRQCAPIPYVERARILRGMQRQHAIKELAARALAEARRLLDEHGNSGGGRRRRRPGQCPLDLCEAMWAGHLAASHEDRRRALLRERDWQRSAVEIEPGGVVTLGRLVLTPRAVQRRCRCIAKASPALERRRLWSAEWAVM